MPRLYWNKACRVFGKPVLRVDAREKLTGEAIYAGDILLPGMLHLKVLRSDRPHARIIELYTERAKAYPGVVDVLIHRDVPGTNRVGPRTKDQPVLCDDKVRHVGDPIALVVAETLEAAEGALELIRVEYDDLPGIFSPEQALAPGAVQIHASGNLLLERHLVKGDPDKALKEADIVITDTYRTQTVEPACIEPEAGVAVYEDGKITVRMASKHAHFEQKEIAAVLGIPPERVRVALSTIGGSFGDKQCLAPAYYAALASLKTGRPCKMVYTREESFTASTNRHPFTIHYVTAATRDGRILAVKIEIIADTGAYSSYGPSVLVRAMIHSAGPYDIANISVVARAVYTNNPVAGAMRGFGVAQMAIAHESQIAALADALKIDPFTIRLINGLKVGSTTATGQRLSWSVGLSETLTKVRQEMAKRSIPVSLGSKRYAWGIGSMYYGIGLLALPNPGVCRIEADDTGQFTVYIGCGDVGQGCATVMTQIVSEVLECDPEGINVITGDTDVCPDSGTSTASRVTYVVGRSVQLGARDLRDLLVEGAASMMEVPKEHIALTRGYLHSVRSPEIKASVPDVIKYLKRRGKPPVCNGFFNPDTTALDMDTGQGIPFATYAFATHGALVSVDMKTGEIELLDIVASHDVGKVVHPVYVVGQIEGGISMGLGYALMEEAVLKEGVILNPRFSEYFVPTALDVPEITSLTVEDEERTGPFGAKGVGEPALLPTAPAILNAISIATGVRLRETPVTQEKLWRLLNGIGK